MSWNFAAFARGLSRSPMGDELALIHGEDYISYRELDRRANGIAHFLLGLDLPRGAHIGHFMRNSNAYLESLIGAGYAAMTHVNINYRYQARELQELCHGLDIRVVIYDAAFADRVAEIRAQCPAVLAWIEVGEQHLHNDFAVSFSSLYQQHNGQQFSSLPDITSSDDIIIIATGGTTGLPKGVQWRHEDLWRATNVSLINNLATLALTKHPAELAEHIANVQQVGSVGRFMPLSPLMHGAGLMASLAMLGQGGTIVTVPGERLDADLVLDTIKREGVTRIALVGDAFARPLLEVLETRRNEHLLAGVLAIISTGASLSNECKQALLHHHPALVIRDTLGSTEAGGIAISSENTAAFVPVPTTRVIDENRQDVVAGSDQIGMLVKGGNLPLGYYKEPRKTAETFITLNDGRYVVTGDRARVLADGRIELLGRDSTCINSGGEKVYTVEVERVLVDHPQIVDALVVGLPHPRFGKVVVAVLEAHAGSSPDPAEISAFARLHLADYKVPKQYYFRDTLGRAANGKPDYPLITAYAADCMLRQHTNS